MRRVRFGEGEFYHVYNRGVEKRNIFGAERDYARFLFDVYAMNDRRPFLNSQFYYRGLASIERLAQRREADRGRASWQRLVDVVCFCLLPNHFHLLLRQRVTGGISQFMQKLGTAYAMYFNGRYRRTGCLFEGTFKAKHVASDQYFLPLTRYIHLNALDLYKGEWRKHGIRDANKAREHLLEYQWSSYGDFVTRPRYPRIVDQALARALLGSPNSYRAYVEQFRPSALAVISSLTIEA